MNHLILALHFLNEFLSFHLFKILVMFALPKQKIVKVWGEAILSLLKNYSDLLLRLWRVSRSSMPLPSPLGEATLRMLPVCSQLTEVVDLFSLCSSWLLCSIWYFWPLPFKIPSFLTFCVSILSFLPSFTFIVFLLLWKLIHSQSLNSQ